MPFPPFKSKKNALLPSDASVSDQPLMYSQAPYAPSEKDSITRSPPTIRPVTHKAITSDVFAEITYYKEQQAKKAAAAKAKAEAEGVVVDQTNMAPEEAFERPATPPQGSRSLPWDSYHDLPADHPVFLNPDDVKERMYRKGIGRFHPECVAIRLDPVVRAMADKSPRHITYGTRTNPLKSFMRRGEGLMNQFGTMHMGGAY